MNTLIVHYSYTGHTKQVAERLRQQPHVDIAEIQTAVPYKGSYNARERTRWNTAICRS